MGIGCSLTQVAYIRPHNTPNPCLNGHKRIFMDLNGYENGYAMKTSGLKISPEMLRLIGEIDEFKGSWRTLPTLALGQVLKY